MSLVHIERIDQCVLLTLDRPEKSHAFDQDLLLALQKAISTLDEQHSFIVLTSTGPVFSSGMDLSWATSIDADLKLFSDTLKAWHNLKMPTLCALPGAAFGGALGFVAASDIAIASSAAFFQLSEIKLGLAPAMIAPYLVDAIGKRRLRYLTLTGKQFSAHDALSWGLLHEVYPADDYPKHLSALLDQLNGYAKQALWQNKALLQQALLDDNLMKEGHRHTTAMLQGPVGKEGIKAFFEKRCPIWPQ